MKKFLRIGLAQINPTVGDLRKNAEKIIDFIVRAKKHKPDILVFPELAICGYPPEDLLLKSHFVEDNLKALHSLAGKISDIIIIVGFVDTDKICNIYNAAAIISNGKLKGVYHKMELPNYGVFDEKRYFAPGKENVVFKLGKLTFGVNICEDIWKAEGPCEVQADAGAKLLINISASPYHAGKGRLRERMLIERARKNKAFICYANLVGGQDEIVFDGGSFIFNPAGKLVASGKQFGEDLIIADLDMGSAIKGKKKVPYSKNVKVINISYKKSITKKLPLPGHAPKRSGHVEEIYNALVLGTRDYVIKNGFKKVVMGLSGGIDSSLTAVIACDAIGKENVNGISMPSQYSSKGTQDDAKILADNLGIKFIEVPIKDTFDSYLKTLSKEFAGLKPDASEENLQARIRGNILMALSNKFGWLVLTTGNKSETSVGYCTLYGDMAGGFAVIKDVPKTLVYELSKFRNKKEDRPIIPKTVLSREPSAELRRNQKDEDTLPPYFVLDPILKAYVEEDRSFEEMVVKKKFNSKLVRDVINMVDKNEYKRRQSPPGIKITSKAFGRDRRLPITNRYKEC